MSVGSSTEFHPGQVIQYRECKAFVRAPAAFAGHWQVENVYDDDGAFAIVAERTMQPAELNVEEAYIWGFREDLS